ncbi:MAG TPA: CrcB family protein [Acidimicrobiales bacterium]|jgi:CrcB protein|nr:CrcB family protein [Acidimicrobiales bacterium]
MTIALIALAGGAGALARWLVDLWAAARFGRSLPWGTIAINIVGSCAAGALAGATLSAQLGPSTTQVLAIGLCGGFTTFSAASVDVARTMERGRPGLGAALLLVPMVLAVSAAIGGFHLAGG